jgi:predicted transcriptional regulator
MQHATADSSAEPTKPLRRVTLTVDPDDYAAMERLARRSKLSASWLVRRSMREFLERMKADRIDPTNQPRTASAENAA